MRVALYVGAAAAAAAGKNVSGWRAVEIDPATLTVEQRAQLARARQIGPTSCCIEADLYLANADEYTAVDATAEELARVLDLLAATYLAREAARARADQEQAERDERQIVAWLARSDSDKTHWLARWGQYEIAIPGDLVTSDARVRAEVARLEPIAARRTAERKIVEEERAAAEDARKTAEDARKTARLTAVIAAHGTAAQRERWAAGVMARAEAIEILEGLTFAACTLASYPSDEYAVKTCTDCHPSESGKNTLSDAQWANAKLVASALPGAEIVYVHQVCTCDNPDHNSSTTLARARIIVGEYVLSRDFLLD